jgi:hypothetical protein
MTCRPSWTTSPKIAAADTRASIALAGLFTTEQARIIQFPVERAEAGGAMGQHDSGWDAINRNRPPLPFSLTSGGGATDAGGCMCQSLG